jgi:Tol biopolymer transport system component
MRFSARDPSSEVNRPPAARATQPRDRTISRRALARAFVGTAGLAAIGCSAPGAPATSPSTSASGGGIGPAILPTAVSSPIKGKLLIVQNGNLVTFDFGSMKIETVSNFPKGAYAASPRMSHDRKRLVYTYYVVPTDPKDLGGSDLYLADGTGANGRLLRAHPDAGATFEDPEWTADGQAILATLRKPLYNSQNQYQGETLSILKVGLDGADPVTVVRDGLGPATSPDGKYLVYTSVDAKGQPNGLRIASGNGQDVKDLLTGGSFSYARAPVFSPDGTRIAFAAVTGTGSILPGKKGGALTPLYEVVEAHGIPWDIWTVRPGGGDLQRLTNESEDTPTPTWSPAGDWVAFAGEIGLYLVDAGGKGTIRVSTAVSGGGVTWFS